MKICYIAHRIPYPPDKGDKIRSFNEIRYLSKRHEVYLACLVDERQDLQHVESLKEYCAHVDVVYRDKTFAKLFALWGLCSGKPLSVVSFYSRELERKITRRLQSIRFDLIFVFSSAMAEYVRDVADTPKVIDFVDVDSEKWRLYSHYQPFPLSWVYRLEADRLTKYEQDVVRKFDYSVFVSERESSVFLQRDSDRPFSVICNGVDFEYFASNGDNLCCSNAPIIVFTGTMDYFPNIDAVRFFCNEILPLINSAIPEVQFYIVGRNPTRQVRDLARRPNVIVTGSVADVRPYLRSAKISVAPLRIARGVQNKILEAMAMGVPVVATSNACDGVDSICKSDLLVADEPREFAQRVIQLLQRDSIRWAVAERGRKRVKELGNWDKTMNCLEKVLLSVCENSKASPADSGRVMS